MKNRSLYSIAEAREMLGRNFPEHHLCPAAHWRPPQRRHWMPPLCIGVCDRRPYCEVHHHAESRRRSSSLPEGRPESSVPSSVNGDSLTRSEGRRIVLRTCDGSYSAVVCPAIYFPVGATGRVRPDCGRLLIAAIRLSDVSHVGVEQARY